MANSLNVLIKKMQSAPGDLASARAEIVKHFQRRLVEERHEISPDLIKEINAIYDIPFMPSLIAEGLGVTTSGVRKALGRTRIVPCKKCGGGTPIFEMRKVGGYMKSNSTKVCRPCRKIAAELQRVSAKKLTGRLFNE
jgi:hypothetical protein